MDALLTVVAVTAFMLAIWTTHTDQWVATGVVFGIGAVLLMIVITEEWS